MVVKVEVQAAIREAAVLIAAQIAPGNARLVAVTIARLHVRIIVEDNAIPHVEVHVSM